MNEKKEKVFMNGMFVFKNQQDWKPFTLSIKIDEVKEYLETLRPHSKDGYVRVDLMQKYGTTDKFYAEVNTYQRKPEVTSAQHSPNRQPVQLDDSGLPF